MHPERSDNPFDSALLDRSYSDSDSDSDLAGDWVTQLPDPDSGDFHQPLNEWLGVKLPDANGPDESDLVPPPSPNQVAPGPERALDEPLTTGIQPPLEYEDIAGQRDPYEASRQNDSLENAPSFSDAESPNQVLPPEGIGPLSGE